MDLGLATRVALVTGASRGIGRAIALSLAAEGARVGVNFVRDRTAAGEVVAEIERNGGQAVAVQADIAQQDQVETMVEQVMAEFGPLDVLVNNAAFSSVVPLDQVTDTEWDEVMDVNLKGPFLCARAVMPILKERGWGRIVNVASIAGKYGSAIEAHYAASKAGVINLTRSLAKHLAPYNVTVNCVAPGSVDTDMFAEWLRMSGNSKAEATTWAPLGRIATPGEVASVVVFLASEPAGFITGETINVNGGVLMD
jgi:3-oxoacyl-[acyl-carrier protein] reductase